MPENIVSEIELNARFACLTRQRDVAQAQNVMDAGTIVVLQQQVKSLEEALQSASAQGYSPTPKSA